MQENKVIWITGASSGIGKALSIKFANQGWHVAASARRENLLKELNQQNKNIHPFPLDVTDIEQCKTVFKNIIEKFKDIEICVFGTGIHDPQSEKEFNLEKIRKIMEVNYFGTIALTKSVLPIMQKQKSGYITTVSSSSGKFGFFLRSSYSASKFAQVGFFESLRLEEEKNNIFISIVFPFLVKTNISLNAISEKGIANKKNDPLIEKGISPEKCAQDIIDGIMNQKKEIFSGGKGAWILNIKRFFPELFFKIMRKQIPN